MKLIKNRVYLSGEELEQIARCSHSMNFLDRILPNKICSRCSALSDTGKFLLQKYFKQTNSRHNETVKKYFEKSAQEHNIFKVNPEDIIALNELNVWVKGVADSISIANFNIEEHFGLFTITDNIDVIDDMGTFTIIKIICNETHQEKIMNYQIMMNSLWLRKNYNIDKNNIMFVKPTHEGAIKQRFEINLSTNILQDSITHILSEFGSKIQEYQQDTETIIDLPVRFGHYCHYCMACFDK